jgi:hypothetical protein
MIFVLIFRAKPVDAATAKLRSDFLKWGFGFAAVTGILGLVPLFLQKSGPIPVRLAFSPDLATQGLSPPKVELPDGSSVQPDEKFMLQPSVTPQVVTVGVDKTLDEVRNLRQASAKLAQTVQTVTEQRDALASQAVPTTAAPAAQQHLEQQSQQTAQLQSQIVKSVQVGDFAHANELSTQLRASAVNVNRAVTAIAGGHQ